MAISFLTGQRLTADLLNANVIDYMATTPVIKSAATSRNTTTTLANDPDLQGIALGVGTWEIELLGLWTQSTTTTQKIKTRWAFTGTWGTAIRICTGTGGTNTATPGDATILNSRGFTLDTQDAVYGQDAGTSFGGFREISRQVVVTVAGNLSLQWAQSASSANNTNLQPGSNFTIRKISA
jgi:hypothetical protein